jgi:hypothetical protein
MAPESPSASYNYVIGNMNVIPESLYSHCTKFKYGSLIFLINVVASSLPNWGTLPETKSSLKYIFYTVVNVISKISHEAAISNVRSTSGECRLLRMADEKNSVASVPHGQRHGSLRPYSRFSRPEPLLFLSSSSSVVLTRLSRARSRPTTSQKIW